MDRQQQQDYLAILDSKISYDRFTRMFASGKRRSEVTKNELMRDLIRRAIRNQISFKYVLMDSWFAYKENFEFIVRKEKDFIAAVKSYRLFARSLEDKLND